MRAQPDTHLIVPDRDWVIPESAAPCRRIRNLVDIIDQNVELALVGSHAVEKGFDLSVVAMVGGHRYPATAGLRHQFSGSIDGEFTATRAATGDVDGGPFLAESDGSPTPDAPAGPGDNRNLPAEFAARHQTLAAGTMSTSRRVRPRSKKLGKYSKRLVSASVKLSSRRDSSSSATLPSKRESAAPRQK